jgi:hypothetical protein
MTGIKGRRWGANVYVDTAIAVGSLFYVDSNHVLQPIAPGTSGDVLTSNGTGAAPSYQVGGGGGSYTDEQAQDAVGAMVDSTLVYVDGTPLLSRAALTGDVTASAGSNTTAIASSVNLPGNPTTTTQSPGDNSTKVATTAYVNAAVAAAGSGAQIFLERHVASSSSSLDFTSFISGTYDKYLIVGESIILATNGAHLGVQFGSSTGPTWDTGGTNQYAWLSQGFEVSGSGVNDSGQAGMNRLFNQMANASGYGFGSFRLVATALQSTSLRKHLYGDGVYANTTPAQVMSNKLITWLNTGTACTGLRFIASAGNIASGSITIYGLTNS